MPVKVKDVAAAIEAFAPLSLQEEYDNSGLNVGDYEAGVTGVLLCVDVTESVIDEALSLDANLVVSHHPLLFHPLRQLVDADFTQRIVRRALLAGISLYAAHTNLDSAAEAIPVSGFLQQVKSVLRCGAIRHSELCREQVRRVALVTGAGASMLGDAVAAGADIYLTADMKYNDFYAPDGRIVAVDVGHFESEYCAIGLLHDIITKKIATFAVHESVHSVNPVNYFI